MKYVILDLEFNGTYNRKLKNFINEIIEFGAVKFDENLNIIDKFSMLVKPVIGKKISSRVKELTNISSLELSEGHNFEYVLKEFKNFMDSCILGTWGITDIQVLMQNYEYYNGTVRIPFITSFIDLQKYCQETLEYSETQQLGLTTAANILNINAASVEHHRALDDSILTFNCFKKLYNSNKILNYIENSNCNEFFEKLNFKVSYLKSVNHPLVDKSATLFKCIKCNSTAKKTTRWKQTGNNLSAKFKCPNCCYEFTGKLQLKLTYDGLIIKKRIV